MKELAASQNLGISIEQVTVAVIPPRQLEAKFAEVLQARQKRDDALNKAESYRVEVLSKAGAESDSRTNAAQSARSRVVGMAEAEAKAILRRSAPIPSQS